jgi:hypothetical protein
MKYVYTTGWTRQKVKREEDYNNWLKSLKNNDFVLTQHYLPAKPDRLLDYPIERWEFELVQVWDATLRPKHGDHRPFNRETGIGTYWGYDTPWGLVFPSRIVPCHNDLTPDEDGIIHGHAPVYEPVWFEFPRLHFLVSRGRQRDKNMLTRLLPYHHTIDVYEGHLVIGFGLDVDWDFAKTSADNHKYWTNWLAQNELSRVRYLYSQQNPD